MEPIPAQGRRRGFNLIEAAIVLGVVGLVIGGIWTAASAVIENQKIAEASAGFLKMYKEGYNLIPSNMVPQGTDGGTIDITQLLIGAKVAPENWINNDEIKDPWGNSISHRLYNGSYFFTIRNLPLGRCRKLVSQITSYFPKKDRSILYIHFSPNAVGTNGPWPISPNDTTYCANVSNNVISFAFYK